jgi:hypothetical protein
MIQHILSLTALLSFLSLGLVADETPSIQNPQEIKEQSSEENPLACACKKKKTNQMACNCKPPVSTDEENKSS